MSRFRCERLEDRYLLSANPANLEVAPVSDRAIELRWTTTPQSNVTGLWVQRAQGDAPFQIISGVVSTTTTFTDTNLSPNTTYRYRIWEQDPDGPSDYSNVASAATNPAQLSRQVIDLGRDGTVPRRLTFLKSVDGSLLFGTTKPSVVDTLEVWKSDGTQAGTVEFANHPFSFLGRAAGTWFFAGGDARLWVSDQTPAGTQPISGPLSPLGLGTAGHKLFFEVGEYGAIGGDPLWVSDGTVAGTMQIGSQLVYGTAGYFGTAGNYLYFVPTEPAGTNNPGLYRTDGTVAGTIRLTDTTPNGFTLTDVNGTMFFAGYDSANGMGLWRSDGTPQGSIFLHPFTDVSSMINVNGALYFSGNDSAGDYGLWTSDGTTQGTRRVLAVAPQLPENLLGPVGGAGGIIYFARDGNTELWRTDGTSQGTYLLHIRQATGGYLGRVLTDGGKEYFTDGQSLWVTDGTLWGTRQIDVSPPPPFGIVTLLTTLNGKIYLGGAAADASSSDNIRVVDTAAPAAPTGLTATSTPATGAAPASVRLTWTDPLSNNESGFVIERSLHPDFSTIDASFYAAQGVTTLTDNQVSGAANYYYRVRAINAAGSSDATPDASASFVVIRGSVFNDANYNGVRDAGEGPMANVTVFVDSNGNGTPDPGEIHTTSGADGQFMLGGLMTGGYLVREVVPAGDRHTTRLPPDPLFATAGQAAALPDFGNVALGAVQLNFAYLLTIAQHYGQSGTIAQGDLTGDERVNLDDLLLLAQHFNGRLPATVLRR